MAAWKTTGLRLRPGPARLFLDSLPPLLSSSYRISESFSYQLPPRLGRRRGLQPGKGEEGGKDRLRVRLHVIRSTAALTDGMDRRVVLPPLSSLPSETSRRTAGGPGPVARSRHGLVWPEGA